MKNVVPGTARKTSEKTSEKILRLLSDDPSVSIADLAERCEVTTRSIERSLKNLQENKKLRRVGPDKGGYWVIFQIKSGRLRIIAIANLHK